MEKSNELKIVEIQPDRIIVTDDFNGRTAIAKYVDKDGIYFFDENNKKKYTTETELVDDIDIEEPGLFEDEDEPKVHPNKKGRYTYDVVIYSTDGWTPGRHFTKTFKADSLKEADAKLEAHYKNIFDAELKEIVDKFGKRIF